MGYVSKLCKPGAKLVSTTASRSTIESSSFQKPDGQIVTVVMNKTEEPIAYKLLVGESEIALDIPAHAMQSIIY